MSNDLYLVRQYRPAYCTGFDNGVVRGVKYEDITKAPWCDNFKHNGFQKLTVEPYGDELIIQAFYDNGEHWVVGFAVKTTDPFANDWRYRSHTS